MALAEYRSDLQADLKISTTPWVYILENGVEGNMVPGPYWKKI
jgi:hypothetical protein